MYGSILPIIVFLLPLSKYANYFVEIEAEPQKGVLFCFVLYVDLGVKVDEYVRAG